MSARVIDGVAVSLEDLADKIRHQRFATLMLAQCSGSHGGAESLSLRFSGGWERYKRVKSVTEPFAQEAAKAHVKMSVALTYDGGLDVGDAAFATIREVLTALGVGKIAVEADELPAVPAEGA